MPSVTSVRTVGSMKQRPRSERPPPATAVAPWPTASSMKSSTSFAAVSLISGPISTPFSVPSPTLSRFVLPASFFANAS